MSYDYEGGPCSQWEFCQEHTNQSPSPPKHTEHTNTHTLKSELLI